MAQTQMAKNGMWITYVALISLATSIVAHLLSSYLFPQFFKSIVTSDAVSIANTYIVFTTLLVVVFATLVAVITFFSAKETSETQYLKLQREFEDQLKSDKNFSDRLQNIAVDFLHANLNDFANAKNIENLAAMVVKVAVGKMEIEQVIQEGLSDFAKFNPK